MRLHERRSDLINAVTQAIDAGLDPCVEPGRFTSYLADCAPHEKPFVRHATTAAAEAPLFRQVWQARMTEDASGSSLNGLQQWLEAERGVHPDVAAIVVHVWSAAMGVRTDTGSDGSENWARREKVREEPKIIVDEKLNIALTQKAQAGQAPEPEIVPEWARSRFHARARFNDPQLQNESDRLYFEYSDLHDIAVAKGLGDGVWAKLCLAAVSYDSFLNCNGALSDPDERHQNSALSLEGLLGNPFAEEKTGKERKLRYKDLPMTSRFWADDTFPGRRFLSEDQKAKLSRLKLKFIELQNRAYGAVDEGMSLEDARPLLPKLRQRAEAVKAFWDETLASAGAERPLIYDDLPKGKGRLFGKQHHWICGYLSADQMDELQKLKEEDYEIRCEAVEAADQGISLEDAQPLLAKLRQGLEIKDALVDEYIASAEAAMARFEVDYEILNMKKVNFDNYLSAQREKLLRRDADNKDHDMILRDFDILKAMRR